MRTGSGGRILGVLGPLVALSAASACGGKQAETGAGATDDAGDPSSGIVFPALTLIDDFEKTSLPNEVPRITNPPFSGGWYVFDDGSLGSSADPNPNPRKQVVQDMALDQPHDTLPVIPPSAHALHMSGGPYTGSWGSGVQGRLLDGAPYDASGFEGILFWAKRASANASTSLHVSLPTIDDTAGPLSKCHAPETPGKHDGCGDTFGKDLTLRDEWNLYMISFSDLAQAGFGYRPPNGFNAANVVAVNLMNRPGAAFDQWIDDIAFYK